MCLGGKGYEAADQPVICVFLLQIVEALRLPGMSAAKPIGFAALLREWAGLLWYAILDRFEGQSTIELYINHDNLF